MLTDILFLVVGAFIGWNIPQPTWARHAQAWVRGKLADFKERII